MLSSHYTNDICQFSSSEQRSDVPCSKMDGFPVSLELDKDFAGFRRPERPAVLSPAERDTQTSPIMVSIVHSVY